MLKLARTAADAVVQVTYASKWTTDMGGEMTCYIVANRGAVVRIKALRHLLADGEF